MKFFFVLCLITITFKQLFGTKPEVNEKCEGIMVHGKVHKKEILSKGLNRPYQLAYDKTDDKIFFSYNIGTDDEDSFAIGYIIKNQSHHHNITDVVNGFALAVDNKDDIIYYGGSGGVYKQHLKGNDTKIKNLFNYHNVWDMFFKENLYFISYPSQRLYKCKDVGSKVEPERQKHIHEKIFQFVIDGENDIFLTNETGLFHIKNGTNHRDYFEGPQIYRALEINNKGIAYFSGQNEIFVANKLEKKLESVAQIKNVFGITFDSNDNIIYSDPHEVVKLVPQDC